MTTRQARLEAARDITAGIAILAQAVRDAEAGKLALCERLAATGQPMDEEIAACRTSAAEIGTIERLLLERVRVVEPN